MKTRKMLGVVIADNGNGIIDRIRQLIELDPNIEFLGSTTNLISTIQLIQAKRPDVVIMDINIGEDTSGNGIMKLLITIRLQFPDIIIIVLSNSVHSRLNCIAYGADYFFDKSYDFGLIPETLRHIHSGLSAS
jgi:two-component system response regulator (stage 0 sporulation protein A)